MGWRLASVLLLWGSLSMGAPNLIQAYKAWMPYYELTVPGSNLMITIGANHTLQLDSIGPDESLHFIRRYHTISDTDGTLYPVEPRACITRDGRFLFVCGARLQTWEISPAARQLRLMEEDTAFYRFDDLAVSSDNSLLLGAQGNNLTVFRIHPLTGKPTKADYSGNHYLPSASESQLLLWKGFVYIVSSDDFTWFSILPDTSIRFMGIQCHFCESGGTSGSYPALLMNDSLYHKGKIYVVEDTSGKLVPVVSNTRTFGGLGYSGKSYANVAFRPQDTCFYGVEKRWPNTSWIRKYKWDNLLRQFVSLDTLSLSNVGFEEYSVRLSSGGRYLTVSIPELSIKKVFAFDAQNRLDFLRDYPDPHGVPEWCSLAKIRNYSPLGAMAFSLGSAKTYQLAVDRTDGSLSFSRAYDYAGNSIAFTRSHDKALISGNASFLFNYDGTSQSLRIFDTLRYYDYGLLDYYGHSVYGVVDREMPTRAGHIRQYNITPDSLSLYQVIEKPELYAPLEGVISGTGKFLLTHNWGMEPFRNWMWFRIDSTNGNPSPAGKFDNYGNTYYRPTFVNQDEGVVALNMDNNLAYLEIIGDTMRVASVYPGYFGSSLKFCDYTVNATADSIYAVSGRDIYVFSSENSRRRIIPVRTESLPVTGGISRILLSPDNNNLLVFNDSYRHFYNYRIGNNSRQERTTLNSGNFGAEIFPNPSNGKELSISLADPGQRIQIVHLYNLRGQRLNDVSFGQPIAKIVRVGFGGRSLSNGLYIIHLHSGTQKIEKKILVCR